MGCRDWVLGTWSLGFKASGFRGFPKLGVPFGAPHNKDYSIFGSVLGSPYFGKLPFRAWCSGIVAGFCRAEAGPDLGWSRVTPRFAGVKAPLYGLGFRV